MATQTAQTGMPSLQFHWILNKRRDLLFYIGSAIVGWIYVAIIVFNLPTLRSISNPLQMTLFSLGNLHFTMEWVIILSWGLIFDAPHLFATLARTFFDPEERQVRGAELKKSWLFFIVGPVMITVPYLLGLIIPLNAFVMGLGALIFLVGFRLWAYYHVVRQHWGFYQLYRRKGGEQKDDLQNTVDYWFFQLSLYLPLVLFLTAKFYLSVPSSAFPDIGLHNAIIGSMSIASLVHPIVTVAYILTLVGYIGFQIYLWLSGVTLNGSKLVYMGLIVPLHFVAFANPIIVLFLTPIVTIGHNIQYHQIVYDYGQRKYVKEGTEQTSSSMAKRIFSNFAIYASFGLMFTFILYRGPWIDWLHASIGMDLNNAIFNSVGMMAGIKDYQSLGLGELIFGSMLLGWAMQHYYLDSKIWRVSKDKMVRKNLNVE